MPPSNRPRGSATERPAPHAPLTTAERRELLRAARRSIAHAIATGDVPTASELCVRSAPILEHPAAAFVTIRAANRRLRGCVGEIFAERPLLESVLDNAVGAALHDRRFPPVDAGELAHLTLEVSVLTPPVSVSSPAEIEVGRHGVLLEDGDHRAVFLPQVALEQGWDRDQLLTQLALKAGLDAEAWRDGAQLCVFEAEKFAETDGD